MLPKPFDEHRWVRLKIKLFAQQDWHCLLCGRKAPLVLHHRNYNSYFDERNVIAICQPCHQMWHAMQSISWQIKHQIFDAYKPEIMAMWKKRWNI